MNNEPQQTAPKNMQPHASAEETPHQRLLQPPSAPLQEAAVPQPAPGQFTVSVEDIRLQLHNIGISKSKDTIQRYCREGELDCLKLGMFKRYYATEQSVEKLIDKLVTDEAASGSMQVHEAAHTGMQQDVQVHAGAVEEDTKPDNQPHEPADTRTQVHAGADNSMVDFLQEQIRVKDEQIKVKDEQIAAMLERDRETNVLIRQLQGSFTDVVKALPGVTGENIHDVADAQPATESSQPSPKPSTAQGGVENDEQARYRV
jgi:hypothetical protein